MTFRINVRSISRNEPLKYTRVESYEIIDGLLIFKDSKTGEIKRYAVPNTEIEEEK